MGISGTAADAVHLQGSNLILEIFEFTDGNPQSQNPERPVVDHGYTHFCLAVSDIDEEYGRLLAAGMKFLGEPTSVAPGVRSVYGRDPFGNVIELEQAAGRLLASKSAMEVVKEKFFSAALGAVFVAVFLAFFLWQTPHAFEGPLEPGEIEGYMSEIDRHSVLPEAEKQAFITRVQQWASNDDGRPVLMVNLMRHRDELGELPAEIEFKGTPDEANIFYEKVVAPLALRRGEYPLVGGDAQATSLIANSTEGANRWDRVVVMRAPSRRAFIEFMADPDYGPVVPYKLASTEVALVPIDSQVLVPDLRWVLGGLLLIVFLFINWRRAVSDLRRVTQSEFSE